MEENLKKALSELMVLALLHEREYYALELAPAISEYSGGIISITFPYSILYRMIEQQYIQELPKRTAPDGRRRQYYEITDKGRDYLEELLACYQTFSSAISNVLQEKGAEDQ